jgi:hypothetical protein
LFFNTSYVAKPNGRVKRTAVESCFAGALAGVVIVASPHALAQDVAMKSPQFTAARVAERYLATHYPDFDTVQERPVVNDKGIAWAALPSSSSTRRPGTSCKRIMNNSKHLLVVAERQRYPKL